MYINLYISSLAQVIHNPALGGLGSLPGPQFFAQLIPALIGLAFVVGVFAFVFYFLFGAVSWIVAGGDKVAIEVARSRVTHAVVGLTVLLLTFAVLNLFECFFGIGLRNVAIGPFNISFVGTYFCPSTGGPPPPPPTPTPTPSASCLSGIALGAAGTTFISYDYFNTLSTSYRLNNINLTWPAGSGRQIIQMWERAQVVWNIPTATSPYIVTSQPSFSTLSPGQGTRISFDFNYVVVNLIPPSTYTLTATWEDSSGNLCTSQPVSQQWGITSTPTPTLIPPLSCGGNSGNICLNSESGLTCTDLCLIRGFSSCTGIGTTFVATGAVDGRYRAPLPNGTCDYITGDCNFPPANPAGITCDGIPTMWTYCNCQ